MAAMAMMSPSRRATCTVARSPTIGILMFWVESMVWRRASASRSSTGRKTTDVYLTMFFVVLFVSFFSLFLPNVMFFFFEK